MGVGGVSAGAGFGHGIVVGATAGASGLGVNAGAGGGLRYLAVKRMCPTILSEPDGFDDALVALRHCALR